LSSDDYTDDVIKSAISASTLTLAAEAIANTYKAIVGKGVPEGHAGAMVRQYCESVFPISSGSPGVEGYGIGFLETVADFWNSLIGYGVPDDLATDLCTSAIRATCMYATSILDEAAD